jgi:hypothetical protein
MGKALKKGCKPPQQKPVCHVPSTILRSKGKEVQKKLKELKLNSKYLGG